MRWVDRCDAVMDGSLCPLIPVWSVHTDSLTQSKYAGLDHLPTLGYVCLCEWDGILRALKKSKAKERKENECKETLFVGRLVIINRELLFYSLCPCV